MESRRQEYMKTIVTLVALLALVGSAMAWDISDQLTYTEVKSGYQEAGSGFVLPQVIGTTSGAYVKEPNDIYGNLWGQVDNKLLTANIDRANTNPAEDATNADFYTKLTQGGSANVYMHSMNSNAAGDETQSEIVGDATAYQNLWVGGQFSKTTASFDSRAIVGMSDIPASNVNGAETSKHFVVTDLGANLATIDAKNHAAGLFDTANMGASVKSGIDQNWAGTGWDEPTYSGGIDMWANFAGACDPHCTNPILTTVTGTAGTGLFPANGEDLAEGSNNVWGAGSIGDATYWGSNFATNPTLQGV
ncbi:MAG: hypothetical protein ACXWMO_04240 [Syntrophales bacterium]